MKKALFLLLVLIMLCGIMPFAAFAKDADHTHTCANGICSSCDTRDPDAAEPILLRYDDRYDITGKTVEIVEGEVVTVEKDTLRATGIGKAKVCIDGELFSVTVEKAKINIVVIMGQSNAGNHFANATSDITCPLGTAYWWKRGAIAPIDYTEPSMGFHTPLLAELYAQSAAAGDPVKNVMVWQEGVTSKNGQSIVKWAASETDTSGTDGTATMIKNCIAYYEKNSDQYEIVNCGIYWLQGESDVSMEPEKYTELFMAMWNKLKNAGAEYMAFFRVRKSAHESDGNYEGLKYHGSLNAQLQMINNNPDMFMASTITEAWVGDASAEHSVDIRNYITLMEEYGKEGELNDSYGNAAIFKNGILTTTMKSLYGFNNKCHYGKFGYGIIGADAAYNMHTALHTTDFSIVKMDTSGSVETQLTSKPGDSITLDITGLEENLAFRASCGSVAGTLRITVKNGTEDITNQVVAKGITTFGTVDTDLLRGYCSPVIIVTYTPVKGTAGSVTYRIIDSTPGHPIMYYWDFETDLCARDEHGEIVNGFENTALQGSYVLEDGLLKATGLHLALEDTIRLNEEENWSIEWKFGKVSKGSGGFLFSSKNENVIGNKAFYHVRTGQFMISDYVDEKGYRNYTIDTVIVSSDDVLKITNRFDSQAGRSILSLWQNEILVIEDFQQKGSFNGSTSDLDMTPYPLSGDFTLSYMGSGKFATVTDEIEYIRIISNTNKLQANHKYESTITAPTCTEKGYITYTCKCGDSYVADVTAALGHSYVSGICTNCGVTDPDYTPATITGKSFTLSFEDEILVNFYYTVSDLTDVTEHGMLVFYADSGTVDYANADAVYNQPVYDSAKDRYMVTTDGIAAKEMGDIRYYVAYAKLSDGTYAYSDAHDYSPRKYAVNMLSKESTSAKQKALCVAMLNYGAAAQSYFSYNTDSLMNAELTDAQQALVIGYDKTLFTGAVAADDNKIGAFAATFGFSKRSATVSFEGAFGVNYYFTPNADVSGDMTLYIWTPEDYAAADTLTAENASQTMPMVAGDDGRYWGQVSGIAAKSLDETYYVAGVYTDANGNTYCTGVIAYSLSKYCLSKAVDGNAMQELASATAMYGYYAKQYFSN